MRRLFRIELSWAFSRALTKLGIAIAANNPMMATTIMISTRVKPAFLFVLICITDLFVFVCSNTRREQRKRLVLLLLIPVHKLPFATACRDLSKHDAIVKTCKRLLISRCNSSRTIGGCPKSGQPCLAFAFKSDTDSTQQ